MGSVGVLIVFAVIGAVICARARVAGGAVVFSLIAAVLFIATPFGQGIPDGLATFVDAVDGASTSLTGEAASESSGGVG
jgi:hypothetical protein